MEPNIGHKKKQIWEKLPPGKPDPIFVVYKKCMSDPRPEKIDLTAGIYKDEKLQPYVIEPIKMLVQELLSNDRTDVFDALKPEDDTKTADLLINEMIDHSSPAFSKAQAEGKVLRVACQSGGNGLYLGFELYKHVVARAGGKQGELIRHGLGLRSHLADSLPNG